MAKTITITITLDLGKIDKTRITTRTYTNKEGVEVTVKEYKIDVAEVQDQYKKMIKDGGTWQIWKTHVVRDSQTKEERAAKTKAKVLGDGITFIDPNERKAQFAREAVEAIKKQEPTIQYPTEEINPNDIPF